MGMVSEEKTVDALESAVSSVKESTAPASEDSTENIEEPACSCCSLNGNCSIQGTKSEEGVE